MSNQNAVENDMPEKLTEEQLFDVLGFARALYAQESEANQISGIVDNELYQTNIANKTLINLNNNGKPLSYIDLKSSLQNYKYSAKNLQEYSEFMKIWDSIYGNTIRYYSNMLSFDISWACVNVTNPNEWKSEEYLKDERRMKEFLRRFKYKQEFIDVVKNILITDTYFVWLRDSSGSFKEAPLDLDNSKQTFGLQVMPQDYCKITGKFNEQYSTGFLWDFDLNYFDEVGSNINNYDSSLKSASKNIRIKPPTVVTKNFSLGKGLNVRGYYGVDGYTRTNVDKGAWVFKFDTSNYNTIPPFIGLLKKTFNNDMIERLQMNKDMISAYGILAGELKTIKTTTSNQKDPFTINPKTLGRLINLIRKGLNENYKVVGLPFENIDYYQYNDSNPTMATEHNKNVTANGASAHTLIYGSDKVGQFELENAIMTDYALMKALYLQFQSFLNYYVNKKTEKYKWVFFFDGSNYPFERNYRINNLSKMLDKGLTPNASVIASTFGYDSVAFDSMLAEAKYGGLIDLTTMLYNANTMASADIGRPKSDTTDLSEGGQKAREYE